MKNSEENEQAEHSAKIMNAGIEAKALMEHPMFVKFFSTQAMAAVNEFTNLPDNAKLNDYKSIHMRLKSINLLKEHLDNYILLAHDEELQLRRSELEEHKDLSI